MQKARIEIRPRPHALQALARRGAWDGPRAWRIVAHTTEETAPRTLAEMRAARPSELWEYRVTPTKKNPPAHLHIPAAVAQLGTALDLTTQTDAIRTMWNTEVHGMILATDPDAMKRRAGASALYLLRSERVKNAAPDQYDALELVWSTLNARRAKRALLAMEEHDAEALIALKNEMLAERGDRHADAAAERAAWDRLIDDARRAPRTENPTNHHDGDTADAGTTYAAWHRREPTQITEIDELPDLIGVYIGRATQIGYRSDKWHRAGTFEDYDHDYTEQGYTPPEVWADRADLGQAHAIVIVGGNQRITPEGID